MQKDFNIAEEAGGVGKAITKSFNTNVTNNTLEIRFYWAGKGTTTIPYKSVYGPLISAISVEHGGLYFSFKFLTSYYPATILMLLSNMYISCVIIKPTLYHPQKMEEAYQ